MSRWKNLWPRLPRLLVVLAYALTVAVFLWICTQYYLPGKGFTYLINFGGKERARFLPELRALNYFETADSYGYDAQYYAQITMHPHLADPVLRDAVDSLPYRARRILFCWTADALSGGNPAKALQIYAVQNLAAWLLLALLLLRWFPPRGWNDFFRWIGILFSFGLCFSIRGALVDGPSLLLIALAMALLESGRSFGSACLLGLAGLGKETNILAAAALPWPWRKGSRTAWQKWVVQMILIVAPLAAWIFILREWVGSGGDLGARNFSWPFAAFVRKCAATWHQFRTEGWESTAPWTALMLLALVAQWSFLVVRPLWKNPWWRLGASYAVLAAVLGDAVWEGYPGAALRVLLPLALVFNVLVPRARRWWPLLLIGNLSVAVSPDVLKPPGRESARISGPHSWRILEPSGRTVEVLFSDREWFAPERSFLDYWRWSLGDGEVTFRNPQSFALIATVSFSIKSNDARHVELRAGNRLLWSGTTGPVLQPVTIPEVTLNPGDTLWLLRTDRPPAFPPGDPRSVAFSLRSFRVNLQHRGPKL